MNKTILLLLGTLFVFGLSTETNAKSPTTSVDSVKQQSTVNLNKAEAKEIARVLTGVGLKKAQSIVEYRKKNGDFKAIEEVASVKGIGVATIAKNQSKIRLK